VKTFDVVFYFPLFRAEHRRGERKIVRGHPDPCRNNRYFENEITAASSITMA
jgi:hypothetical protein